MTVLVMCVRVVRVPVPERGVVVRVAVRFFAVPREVVLVLVVFIMQMGVRMIMCGWRIPVHLVTGIFRYAKRTVPILC